MGEVRRIRVSSDQAGGWMFADVLSSLRGPLRGAPDGLVDGDELSAELRAVRGGWEVVRVLASPQRFASPPASAGSPATDAPTPPSPRSSEVTPGQVRSALLSYDSRSASEADADGRMKRRPCVVVWVDGEFCGVRFVFNSSGRRRRFGASRRLSDWRAAGLRKPSMVDGLVHVRSCRELGSVIGVLVDADAAWACAPPAFH